VTKEYQGKLPSVIEDLDLPNPVIRSHDGHGFGKPHVRDDRRLRTEPVTNNVYDYGVHKDVAHLRHLRDRSNAKARRAHDSVQPKADIRSQAGSPTATRRDACLPISPPAASSPPPIFMFQPSIGRTEAEYSLASLRYDRSKLRPKGWVERIPHSRRYRLAGGGYSIQVTFLKRFEKIYALLTAGLLRPFCRDRVLAEEVTHAQNGN
jgi:hypothetical protein